MVVTVTFIDLWVMILCLFVCMFVYLFVCLFVFGATAPSGLGPPYSRGFCITHDEAPQSVGHLWTSDRLVAETSLPDNTQQQTKIHAPQWDSNPQSQQAGGRRPTPVDRATTGTGHDTV